MKNNPMQRHGSNPHSVCCLVSFAHDTEIFPFLYPAFDVKIKREILLFACKSLHAIHCSPTPPFFTSICTDIGPYAISALLPQLSFTLECRSTLKSGTQRSYRMLVSLLLKHGRVRLVAKDTPTICRTK